MFQKLQYDSDTSEKFQPEEPEPKISIKTRHPSGDKKPDQEPTRIVESKRRSFIVSRVPEHTVISDKINEDEGEDLGQDQPSPESTQNSVRADPSPNLLQTQYHQPSDSESYGFSDTERSVKSQGKDVPVNIVDLEQQLTRLTRGGGHDLSTTNLSAHASETHSPVPGEEGTSGQLQPPGQQQQGHQSSQDKQPGSDGSQSMMEKQPSLPGSQQSTIQSQKSGHTPLVHQPQGAQLQQPVPLLMTHNQSNQSLTSNMSQSSAMTGQSSSQQQQPQQQQKSLQPQGSSDMPANPNMQSGVYPYFPMMQPPMYGYQHHHPGMMHMYQDQVHPMQYLQMPNQMVPYVMINVQQQHQIAPMWVPANMIMPNQMPFMGAQPGMHMPHQHSDQHSESVAGSPPSTPPQSRKQHSIDTQSDSGIPGGEVSSPAPLRGNYSIASLEQELIRKLHGGSRKDIPITAGGGSMLNESFSQTLGDGSMQRLHDDRPHWAQSSESLTGGHTGPTESYEGLKRVDEADNIDGESVPSKPKDEQLVQKKLRFQVERVADDPLKLSELQSELTETMDSIDTQSASTSGEKEVKSEQDTDKVSKKQSRLGRFSVTKVVEKSANDNESVPQALQRDSNITENKNSVIKGNSEEKDDNNKEAQTPSTIHEESESKTSGGESHPEQAVIIPDKPSVSRLHLHDLPYRKKSMSFFEGNNSPMLSNNTCDSFYNTHMDRFQIFSRRRTKSLGSIQSVGSMHSISMQTQCTQYGDGETPSPSPSPRDADREFPEILFDLTPVADELSSSDDEKESQDGAESGIDSGSRIISPRPPLLRQARKVRSGILVRKSRREACGIIT